MGFWNENSMSTSCWHDYDIHTIGIEIGAFLRSVQFLSEIWTQMQQKKTNRKKEKKLADF